MAVSMRWRLGGRQATPKRGGVTMEMTAISFKIPDLDDQDTDHSPLYSHPHSAQTGCSWRRLPPSPILTALRLGGVHLEERCCQFRNISACPCGAKRENAIEKVPRGRGRVGNGVGRGQGEAGRRGLLGRAPRLLSRCRSCPPARRPTPR